MRTTEARPAFTAATNKFAYAQAFTTTPSRSRRSRLGGLRVVGLRGHRRTGHHA